MIKELKNQNVWILQEDLQGSFGYVYISKKEVQGFNIRVVLKEIDIGQKQSHKTQKLGSVTNEKLASRLMHFGIVPLLAFHDDHKNGKYYFVSPFLVNGDLFDVIQFDTYNIRNKMQFKLDWKKRVKIMYQIASALDYMHAGNKFRGTILHMDIKSKNIVLDSKFNARLIDFGLSRELKEGDESLAVTALPLGTKGYYPTMQHNMLTKQHDYHNFGVVILELITGLEACTTDQGLELRKWNLRRIKDRQQVPRYRVILC
ncbi:uncharacterized protein LOC127847888 [Dreissena polymorpha]|uniref:uncharacterized protein LOC127847888 n=1 Tax=Dreissena polymorpha TaxID=45954 RepID=UPI0022649B80|nr:uncharacterized protein LOC127847888 [Dreissena polymorpha]